MFGHRSGTTYRVHVPGIKKKRGKKKKKKRAKRNKVSHKWQKAWSSTETKWPFYSDYRPETTDLGNGFCVQKKIR